MKQFLNYLLNKHFILRIVIKFLSKVKQERIYIARFRAEMLYWGHDMIDFTDEEIKKGIGAMSELVSSYGLTLDQTTEVLKRMANFKNVK